MLGVLSVGAHRADAFSADDLEFLGKVASQIAIAVDNALAYGEIEQLKDKLTQEKVYLEDEIRSELNFEEIVGNSEGLRRVLKQIETVAPTDSTVLICGETGTGKELIARAVHNLSARKTNAFVKLNCAAIPHGLCSKVNSSGTKRAHLREQSPSESAVLSLPTRGQSSWTRLGRSHWSYSRSCCAFCRNASLNAWAVHELYVPMLV